MTVIFRSIVLFVYLVSFAQAGVVGREWSAVQRNGNGGEGGDVAGIVADILGQLQGARGGGGRGKNDHNMNKNQPPLTVTKILTAPGTNQTVTVTQAPAAQAAQPTTMTVVNVEPGQNFTTMMTMTVTVQQTLSAAAVSMVTVTQTVMATPPSPNGGGAAAPPRPAITQTPASPSLQTSLNLGSIGATTLPGAADGSFGGQPGGVPASSSPSPPSAAVTEKPQAVNNAGTGPEINFSGLTLAKSLDLGNLLQQTVSPV